MNGVRNRLAVATVADPPLSRSVEQLDTLRMACSEIEDLEMQEAAFMAIEAAELDLRAQIRAARRVAGIPTVSLAEAERIRETLLTGGAV